MNVSQTRQVHYERLHDPGRTPWRVRMLARAACYALVLALETLTAVFERLRRRPDARRVARPARMVLTGTFFSDNWVEAHIRPLGASPHCERIWVVADSPFIPMENVTYVCPPRWLQRLIGRVPSRSILFVWTALRTRADVVGGFHLLLNGLIALAVSRVVGARVMYFCVGGWAEFVKGGVHGGNKVFNLIGREDDWLEKRLLRAVRRFDLILTMGTGARDYLLAAGVSAPVRVMPGGIDQRSYTLAPAERDYDLITVCRIAPVKRLDIYLRVIQRVAQRVPGVRACVVGEGDELPKLKALARELGIERAVDFVGKQNDVPRWLARARVFVLTSDSEGLSLALMEAAMVGLPAVVSDVGDLGDLVADGVNGGRPPPRDVQAFAERLAPLLTDGALYERFAAASRAAALALSYDVMCGRWDGLLADWGFPPAARSEPPAPKRAWHSRRALWERSRRILRRPAARLLSKAPPAVWLGGRFRRELRRLEAAQGWDRAQAERFQIEQARRICAHAYQRSPFYRQFYRQHGLHPRDIQSLADLRRAPTIDADVVRREARRMLTVDARSAAVDRISTGGTGGSPLTFFVNADRSAFEFAHLVASWRRIGFDLNLPLAVFRGRVVAPDRDGLRHEYDPLLRHHHYSVFHLTEENIRRYLDHVRGLGPCYLHVYPSAVAALAQHVRDARLAPLRNVRGVIAESEMVYPEQRRLVEEVFGCRYFSCYGHTEKLVLGAECEHAADYHVWPTYGYFELLDEQGEAVTTPGERGEIVGTGFVNTVCPFIRYRTGDYATYVADRCEACGRAQTLIRDVRSHRTHEMLIAADGAPLSWAALNMHDDTFNNVLQFQFRQEQPGRAALWIVPGPSFGGGDAQRILRRLSEKVGDRLAIDIRTCEAIPRSPRGKAVYVDQRIPLQAPLPGESGPSARVAPVSVQS